MISQFDSRCPACGEKIYEGDEIAKDEDLDAWVHDECYEPPIRIDRSKLKAAKKSGPSLAEKLDALSEHKPGDPLPLAPGVMSAHEAVQRIVDEAQTNLDAAADVLVNWAVAHGAKR